LTFQTASPLHSASLSVLSTLWQGSCTTRGPDPAPERVLSGPRSRFKKYKKRFLNDRDFMNEFELH